MKPSRSLLPCALALILMLLSILAVAFDISTLRKRDFSSIDSQLTALAGSVDNTISSYLQQYTRTLQYVLERNGFLQAEQEYLDTGSTNGLFIRMTNNLLIQDESVICMLALDEGRPYLSTDGLLDYVPIAHLTELYDVNILLCRQGDTLSLMFCEETSSGAEYAAIIDLRSLYRQIATEDTLINMDSHIVLLDASRTFCLHPEDDTITVCMTNEITSKHPICSGLPHMARAQQAGEIRVASYPMASGKSDTAHMAIIPAQLSKNGLFTIGTSVNFDELCKPLYRAVLRMACAGGIGIANLLLLIYQLLTLMSTEEKSRREIRALTEKNQIIEAVNRSQQTLLHHQRLQTIGELTSGVAHEFGNLLTPIMGYSLMALERLPEDDSGLYDDLLRIYESSKSAQEITRRLLELSRADTSSAHVRLSSHILIKHAAQMISPSCGERITLTLQLDDKDASILGDETQLIQMLLNLCINALHAMEDHGGTLTLCASGDAQSVTLSVEDTGCGMTQQTLDKIYEPFYTTRESGKGTGLGLYIVRHIADAHEATIRVRTAPGEGTRFDIRFLRAQEDFPSPN